MKKYLKVLGNNLQSTLIYRLNSLVFILSQFFIFGVFFYLWSSVYRQGGQVGDYSLAQMIFYYLAVSFLNVAFNVADTAKMVGEDIRQGQLNNFLTKPVNYFFYKTSAVGGRLLYNGIVALAACGLIGWLLAGYLDFSFQAQNLLVFLLLAGLGFCVNYLIFYFIGLTTFWLGFVLGFNYIMQMISSFLEGSLIPLDLLPGFVVDINNWLPFKYAVFTPISVLTGRLPVSLSLFLTPLAWIAALYIINQLVFKAGLKKYEGFGA
jgi:ABC-2 type transport system permease protein